MSLEQNAKTKPEALERRRKRWLSQMDITTALQQQHYNITGLAVSY